MDFLDERFWLAVSFFIFIYIAYKPVKKAVLGSLDAKINSIKAQILEAENLKKEAKLLFEKTEIQMNHLVVLRAELLHDAKITANQLIEEGNEQIEALLQRKKSETATSIERQKLQACSQIQSEFSETVIKTVTEYFKLSKNDLTKDSEIAKNLINNPKI